MTEQRIVLQHCGFVNPLDIDTWCSRGGFQGLAKARAIAPALVVDIVKQSGLRGRGGAGFPVGLKWDMTGKAPGGDKYVLCNADEGEPGTFKDRYILEHDPFTLIEGIAVACYAVGARQAYIYLRGEYRHLLGPLRQAIVQAERKEDLGCRIEVWEGAGAYVCGEESALMESLEGKRGEPRFRPPFPPTQGLWGKPTVINNLETLMNVPHILTEEAGWFGSMGTEQSKGTKVFSVSGDVAKPGVYEVAMGTPLRDLVEGLAEASDTKLVQVGGASGRVLPNQRLDTPLAFEAVLGAGAIIVYNNSRNAVEIALRTMEFFVEESCGKCTPCREGTQVMAETLGRIMQGQGREKDLTDLLDLSEVMGLASLCGLGQAAPNCIVDTYQHFEDEYRARLLK
ncbi:MAG: NADH-ubiquinone oxidoreductase-F iron-sulfur binding region domain-containing protein [Dehalococcoidia bacterium]|nr:NADH-ubiquinone oxidoreductase-F iron-sulfur binding region domain-containing protein [Dehalococcoidia bacterium]